MAVATKRFGKGLLTGTLYTVPSGTTALLKAITVCNLNSTDNTFSITLAGTSIIQNHKIKGSDTITIPFLDQVIQSGETITGSSGTANSINYYMSGKEVT
ncbi:hypothetical protein ACWIE6_02005 [Paenibacillus taichungensis]